MTIELWNLCHCLYLQCKVTLKKQIDGHVTIYEGLYNYNNMGEISEGRDLGRGMGNLRAYGIAMQNNNNNIIIIKYSTKIILVQIL